MDRTASRLDAAAAALVEIERGLGGPSSFAAVPAPSAFAADADGLPGRAGQVVHARWADLVDAAAAAAGRLAHEVTETAVAVRTGRAGYAHADDLAHRRLQRGM